MKESDMTPPCQEACCRHKHREAPEYDALIKRLNRIEGQVRGLQRMISQGEYCIDILTQVSAVQSALDSVAVNLLKDHMNHCVVTAARESDEAAQAKVDEAAAAIARLIKS